MQKPRTRIEVFRGPAELAGAADALVTGLIRDRCEAVGVCNLVLSGGSTPAGLYRLLAAEPAGSIPWDRVHLFWGDERCLPPDHPESNFRTAHETLLQHIAIPRENILRMPGELGPEAGAMAYHQELVRHFGPKAARPGFDLVLLGLGPDGHTASLFPGRPLDDARGRWVMGVEPGETEPRVDRITLTLAAINAARVALFLVSGRSKAAMVRAVGRTDPDSSPYPAGRVRPQGELIWLLDQAAAGS